ncbi:hypothetical protein RI367_005387 [Sorochytrium milnesiophthora]
MSSLNNNTSNESQDAVRRRSMRAPLAATFPSSASIDIDISQLLAVREEDDNEREPDSQRLPPSETLETLAAVSSHSRKSTAFARQDDERTLRSHSEVSLQIGDQWHKDDAATPARVERAGQSLDNLRVCTFGLQMSSQSPAVLSQALALVNTPLITTAESERNYMHIKKCQAALDRLTSRIAASHAPTAPGADMSERYMGPVVQYLKLLQSYLAAYPLPRLNTSPPPQDVQQPERPPSPQLPFDPHGAWSYSDYIKQEDQHASRLFFLAQLGNRRYKSTQPHRQHSSNFLVWMSTLQALVFIATIVYANGFAPPSENFMLGPPFSVFRVLGGNEPVVIKQDFAGESWRLVTPIFLHAGLIHLALNVFTQVSVGMSLESSWSSTRVAAIYVLSSIGGNTWSAMARQQDLVTVGASGGLMGLFGAVLADSITNHDVIWHPKAQAIYWSINGFSMLLCGLAPIIDNIVHVAGFATGFFAGLIFIPTLSKNWHRRALSFAVGVVGAGLLLISGISLLAFRPDYDCTPTCCYLFLTLSC